jgi:hypothetical protein
MDYWALGGSSEPVVVRSGEPWIVYPGTPQARHPAEAGAKGAMVVEVEDGVVREVGFADLDRVRCLDLRADTVRADALVAEAERLRREHPGKTLLLEIELPASGAGCDPAARDALLHELGRRVDAWSPAVGWVGFRGLGAPGPGAVRRSPPELAREIANLGRSLAENPDAAGRFLEKRFEPLLSTWVATFEPGETPALFRDAADLALRLLDAGDAP